jgi:hypothetical protein
LAEYKTGLARGCGVYRQLFLMSKAQTLDKRYRLDLL